MNAVAKKAKTRALRCPTCRKLVTRDDPEFPFCSERCRTIDLGKWASGDYVISTPINDPEAMESQPSPRPNGHVPDDEDRHQ